MVRWWRYQCDTGDRITKTGNEVIDLATRQLPALTWLRALCHFDL